MRQSDESDTKPDPLRARFMESTEQELADLIGLIEAELCNRGWSPHRVWKRNPPQEGRS